MTENAFPPAFIELLRGATEADAAEALAGAYVALAIVPPAEALELFTCVLDVLTGERDRAMACDEALIAMAAQLRF